MAEDVHAAPKHLEPRRPATVDLVGHSFSWRQGGQVQAGVLMNGQRAIGAIGRGYQTEPATLLRLAQGKLLVTRLQPLPLRQEPDLVEMDRFRVRGVELAVAH